MYGLSEDARQEHLAGHYDLGVCHAVFLHETVEPGGIGNAQPNATVGSTATQLAAQLGAVDRDPVAADGNQIG